MLLNSIGKTIRISAIILSIWAFSQGERVCSPTGSTPQRLAVAIAPLLRPETIMGHGLRQKWLAPKMGGQQRTPIRSLRQRCSPGPGRPAGPGRTTLDSLQRLAACASGPPGPGQPAGRTRPGRNFNMERRIDHGAQIHFRDRIGSPCSAKGSEALKQSAEHLERRISERRFDRACCARSQCITYAMQFRCCDPRYRIFPKMRTLRVSSRM